MTNKYRIVYSPKAYNDLRAIYAYSAFDLKEVRTAQRQVDRIRAVVNKLDILPERHEVIDWEPWASMGMRKVYADKYIVFYIVDNDKKNSNCCANYV